MAYYWKTRYRSRRRKYPRRRPWFSGRRTRRSFQRTRWRKRKWRRKFKVKKFKFPKKKKFLILKQFQPHAIRRCKVKGYKCLFQGHPDRASNNYIQYIYSYIPPDQPGGGLWSLLVFSLDSLWEDYNHLENIWTESNSGLPLIRYQGCKFTLYQSEETDYVFCYDNCWPMVDTIHKHADSAPFRMLQKKNKIIVPSKKNRTKKKPYKKVFIRPPAQMTNKWYFQKDICKTPLVMTTTTACSLNLPFANLDAKNNNLTISFLNPYIFKNSNFQHYDTSGYFAKYTDDTNTKKLFLYASTQHNITYTNLHNNSTLIALADTKNHKNGTPLINATETKLSESWGNPFHSDYTQDNMYIYISNLTPSQMFKKIKENQDPEDGTIKSITRTGSIILTLRYNPANDDGSTNKIYLVNNELGGLIQEPNNENYILSGFPLHTMLWGWTDWIRKLGTAIHFDTNYFVTIKSEAFNEKRLPYVIPVDDTFVHNFNPYENIHQHDPPGLTEYNKQNWYPRHEFQKVTINNICLSGPACPRPPWKHYQQAICKYEFYFKFGGCPKTLEKIYNPCSQPRWPTTDNILPRYEIKNPNTNPATELYSWDWEKDYVTEGALQRIIRNTEIDPKIFSISESKNNVLALQKVQEDPQEKEEKELLLQLYNIRHQRVLLELKLRQLK